MVTQPHPARSIVSESGLRCLRPGYMAAYTRSLIPVYLAYGNESIDCDKGLVASFVKARANSPNILMSEKSWSYLCFTAGQQEQDSPVLVCVNRGKHSFMKDFATLEQLNHHMSTCFTKHEELVMGKCTLTGVLDHPPPRDSGNKKGKKD